MVPSQINEHLESQSYESIYRLVLITHQSRGPVAGAIAGKRRSGILGPRSPLNQPWARHWVLALAIPAP